MIRVVYRSYGGENLKGRPPFYSKDLALWSLLRAAQSAAVRPTFLNDGPIPEARLDVMGSRGEVRSLSQRPAGMRSSYWSALRFAARSNWPDDDVVLFSEDDYLYTSDALVRLAEAADALPGVSYFAPYASTPRLPSAEFPRGYAAPPGWAAGPPVEVGGIDWVRVVSTTSTFAARLGALRADSRLFRLGMGPYRTRLLDHETLLTVQGLRPFRGSDLLLGRPEDRPDPSITGVVARAVLVPYRVMLNASSLTRRSRPHLLYAPEPNLACHLEEGVMTPGRDWSALASEVLRWAHATGMTVSSGP